MVLSNDDVSFLIVLNTCRTSTSEHDKGNRFERLIQAYLLTDPKYSDRLVKVWLWSEFPYREQFGAHDLGIDLVGLTDDDEYWAIQCKCYQEDTPIDKPKVDSFLSTSGRSFRDESQRQISFSHRFWVSTSNKWGPHAQETLLNQNPPVTRINLYDLQEAPVDWGKLEQGVFGDGSRHKPKELFQHQKIALEQAHEYFKNHDRGKLIMACGTGKTLTSLRIAENETDGDGMILLLVPSIALLGQSLREWSADAKEPIHPVCICSDPQVTKDRKKQEDLDLFSVIDLAWPASTNVTDIVRQLKYIRSTKKKGLTVVFSTYQSIEVISKAQKRLAAESSGFGIFDLIICDEAHRTTGVALTPEDSSDFIKVHDDTFLEARRRLYMTATPRLYSDEAKGKAAQAEAILCSMDDEKIYGEEIYRIGFGEAVERDLLSDYKVLILTLSDKDIPPAIQNRIANKEQEINFDDATKLIGCINALSKQIWGDDGALKSVDSEPMKKAVAFCQSIKVSKKITEVFNSTTELYLDALPREKRELMVSIEAKHIDGTMNAPHRDELLGWLKTGGEAGNKACHILSNVRCLSEGVDVPSLDAVMFLSARNSHVDVVQSVGRVMRKSQKTGKKYGYIIIPVVVPSDVDPSKALDDNERYKVVWMVLNALRAHDDRFNAIVNKIELNKKPPVQILVGGTGVRFDGGNTIVASSPTDYAVGSELGRQLAMQFEQLQSVVFARMVQKVGDRRYWEQWAQSVAEIAARHVERINRLIAVSGDHRAAFDEFLNGLQKNINPSITQTEAVEMLSQHIITKPVFEALFENYSFVKSNPISVSMQTMLDLLEAQAIEKDTAVLDKFYASVRKRAEGIDNAEARQRIIIELYDKFFKTAFPRMAKRLGIVFTPVEIVDFINHSVSDILQKEFGRSLSDENIHILDPFTGTGTFIVRMIQSALISKEDLLRKYQNEIHANEIVLLAYYIAAINIENAFHDAIDDDSYRAFDGICLTDTFQLGETDASEKLFSRIFPQNSERVQKQKKAPLRVIIGNPPYSKGKKSANDNAQNRKYLKLDNRISNTYIRNTSAGLSNSSYNTYIKAFRWSTDRLASEGGIVCFVTDGGWIDGNAQDGLRKCLEEEFSSIYVFNTRGNARTQGELRRKEAGNVFGAGSRTPIAITLLVKKPQHQGKATIYYHDIGDYLSREEKLSMMKGFGSVENSAFNWQRIIPNEHGDWIEHRSNADAFETFIPIEPKKKFTTAAQSFFVTYAIGSSTNRDAWVYNSSRSCLSNNMNKMIDFYNHQRIEYARAKKTNVDLSPNAFFDTDSKQIKWTRALRKGLCQGISHSYDESLHRYGAYRPYFKQLLYFDSSFIECPGLSSVFLPNPESDNKLICVSGVGVTKDFSSIITNTIPDLELIGKSQCFPLYYYEECEQKNTDFFDSPSEKKYIRRDAVTDFILKRAQEMYGPKVTKEDIFYYVYGFLHSPEYKKTFTNDLKKMLPRIPLVEESSQFWEFSKAGRELADLHINYESVSPYPEVEVVGSESGNYRVEKMRFPKKGQKDTIIYNSHIRIEKIPGRAYEYIVNGKSAIEWIMERYQVTVHSESGIRNDPNDWADEVGNPRYILDLLLSIINVSVQTMEIVDKLPKLKFE